MGQNVHITLGGQKIKHAARANKAAKAIVGQRRSRWSREEQVEKTCIVLCCGLKQLHHSWFVQLKLFLLNNSFEESISNYNKIYS